MPVSTPSAIGETKNIKVSPLQMALAAATLSNTGVRPAPRIALAVNTPQEGWVVLPALGEEFAAFSGEAADTAASAFAKPERAYWEWSTAAKSDDETVVWYMGGTLPSWRGSPLSLALLLESDDLAAANRIGEGILDTAVSP
jgi:membrane peptidoglycan carboxypeptidase